MSNKPQMPDHMKSSESSSSKAGVHLLNESTKSSSLRRVDVTFDLWITVGTLLRTKTRLVINSLKSAPAMFIYKHRSALEWEINQINSINSWKCMIMNTNQTVVNAQRSHLKWLQVKTWLSEWVYKLDDRLNRFQTVQRICWIPYWTNFEEFWHSVLNRTNFESRFRRLLSALTVQVHEFSLRPCHLLQPEARWLRIGSL